MTRPAPDPRRNGLRRETFRVAQPGLTKSARERGAAQSSLLLAIGAGGLLLIPLLVVAAVLGGDTSLAGCGTLQPVAQPGVAAQAQASIPASYLTLYQQSGQLYGLPWNVLAAIGEVESDHGRYPGPGIRSGANAAGAAGPMQIGIGGRATNNWGGAPRHPATERTGGVGVDGNGDGWANVYDPADAIPGAARYLLAHGAPSDLNRAVFAYNHSTPYVRDVMEQAARYAAAALTPAPNTGISTGGEVVVGCSGDVGVYQGMPGDVVTKVLTYAKAQLGKPYAWGAEGPDTFDCSGLTMSAYRAAGITIPRVTFNQWNHGTRIPPGAEQPGDLVFFDSGPNSGPDRPGHVGLVYNPRQGLMIAAPRSGDVVKIRSYRNRSPAPMGYTRPHPSGNNPGR